MSTEKRKFKFKGKQFLAFGLVALVLAAGYYRWTVGSGDMESVSVTSDVMPVNSDSDAGEENGGDGWGEQNGDAESDAAQTASPEQGTDSAQPSGAGIAASRQARDSQRSETMDSWKEIQSSADASQTAKQEAEKSILEATENQERESSIETQIKAKGFSDCFTLISNGTVSVIVQGGNLDNSSVAQIKDIIISETGAKPSQIKISAE